MSSKPILFRRVISTTSRLIESYCPQCGLFIAASPRSQIVESVENLHQCQAEIFDRLMRALSAKEPELLAWISRSETNTQEFVTDPISAIRAANLEIDDDSLQHLELIMISIARKLRGTA